MSRSRSLIATALLVTALAVPVGITHADGGAESRIKITKLRHTGAKGVVKSERKRCIRRRKVSFFVIENFVSDKLEITKTNSDGKWKIRRDLDPGRYFAKVDARRGCRLD